MAKRYGVGYRTRSDQRLVPLASRGVPVCDNVDRIANGVRLEGQDTVHARSEDGGPECGTAPIAAGSWWLRTTRPVTCRLPGCREHA